MLLQSIALGGSKQHPSKLNWLDKNIWKECQLDWGVDGIEISLRGQSLNEKLVIPYTNISAIDIQFSTDRENRLFIETRKRIHFQETKTQIIVMGLSVEDIGVATKEIKSRDVLRKPLKKRLPRWLFQAPFSLLLPFYSRKLRKALVSLSNAFQLLIAICFLFEMQSRLPSGLIHSVDTITHSVGEAAKKPLIDISATLYHSHPILYYLFVLVFAGFAWPFICVWLIFSLLTTLLLHSSLAVHAVLFTQIYAATKDTKRYISMWKMLMWIWRSGVSKLIGILSRKEKKKTHQE